MFRRGALVFTFLAAAGLAHASLIVNQTPTDLSNAHGFGNFPAVLTAHNNDLEEGCVSPTDNSGNYTTSCSVPAYSSYTNVGSVGNGSNFFATPTLSDLQVTSFGDLRILFNISETGAEPHVTLQNMRVGLFDGSTLKYAFDLDAPVDINSADQGQGSSGYLIKLVASEYQNLTFNGAYRIGLAATVGCILTSTNTTCDVPHNWSTADGNESFTPFSYSFVCGSGGCTPPDGPPPPPPPPPGSVPEPESMVLLLSGGALIAITKTFRR